MHSFNASFNYMMKMAFKIFFQIFLLIIPMKMLYVKLCFFFGIFEKLVMITTSKEELGLLFRYTRQRRLIFIPTSQLGRSTNDMVSPQLPPTPLLPTRLILQPLWHPHFQLLTVTDVTQMSLYLQIHPKSLPDMLG